MPTHLNAFRQYSLLLMAINGLFTTASFLCFVVDLGTFNLREFG